MIRLEVDLSDSQWELLSDVLRAAVLAGPRSEEIRELRERLDESAHERP